MTEKINWNEVTLSPTEKDSGGESQVQAVGLLPDAQPDTQGVDTVFETAIKDEIRATMGSLEKPVRLTQNKEVSGLNKETPLNNVVEATDETLQEFANNNLGSLAYDAERWSGEDKKINIADTLRAHEKEAKGDKLATAGVAVGTAGAIGILSIPGVALLTAGGTTLLAAGAFAMLPAAGLGFLGHKGYKIFKSWKSNRAFEKLTGESHKDVLRRNEMIRL